LKVKPSLVVRCSVAKRVGVQQLPSQHWLEDHQYKEAEKHPHTAKQPVSSTIGSWLIKKKKSKCQDVRRLDLTVQMRKDLKFHRERS